MSVKITIVLLVSVSVIHAGTDDWADCSSPPAGVSYVDCPIGPGHPGSGEKGGGDYTQLQCCTKTAFSGDGPGKYEFIGGHYELVIISAGLQAGAKLYIRNVRCQDDGACKIIVIDAASATFPLTLSMSSGKFKFTSEEDFSVMFFATNQPKTGCKCCKDGWDQFAFSCYRRSTLKSGFHAVEDNCNSLNVDADAHLASIHSLAEHNFIQGKYTPEPNPGLWIGLHDTGLGNVSPRTWVYTDGSPDDFDGKWLAGEPNNAGNAEDCAHLWTAVGYKWNDIGCNSNMVGVCKYDIFPY